MPKANDVMVDLETLSTAPNATIVSIGVVVFDRNGCGDRQYLPIKLDSYKSFNDGAFHICPNTVQWWMGQSNKAREVFTAPTAIDISSALVNLTRFLEKHATRDVRVWGNGSDFDNVILANAFTTCGLEVPWSFWNNRCYRTVKNMLRQVKMKRLGTHHNALDDAISQADHLVELSEYELEVFS